MLDPLARAENVEIKALEAFVDTFERRSASRKAGEKYLKARKNTVEARQAQAKRDTPRPRVKETKKEDS